MLRKIAAMIDAVRAMNRLRRDRRTFIQTAAQWQEAGLNTDPLNLPVIELQEAIAELEAVDLEAQAATALSVRCNELRNHFNAVRVSGAGLETETDPSKRLLWLDLMEQAADRCIEVVRTMEPLYSTD